MHKISFSLILIVVLAACQSQKEIKKGVHVENIAAAEQLFGIEFTPQERDSMQDQLRRNLRGYNQRMEYSLNNAVPMALYFDPRPVGFKFQQIGEKHTFLPDTIVKMPSNIQDIAFFGIPQLAGLLVTGQITSVELTQFYIDRIKTYDPYLYSVITLTEDRALASAERADREIRNGNYRGILHGIPYGVKDLLSAKGYKTTWGAAPYKDQIIDEDAEIIKKLEEKGAVLIAKLSSGALASGDVWFGGMTRNPWNPENGASGSSAGPGSATSAGLVPYSIGSETWGSILSPSARCGITGFRPTFGYVSRNGAMTLSWSMDKLGPMCRNAYDCAIVFDAIYGYDEMDRSTVPYGFNYNLDVKKLRIGYFKELFEGDYYFKSTDSLTLEVFRKAGFELVELEIPDSIPYSSLATIIRAESGAIFDEITSKNLDDLMVRQDKNARPTTLRQSHFIPAVEYIQANRFRYELIEKMDDIFDKVDIILSPASQGPQSLITNLTGHPAIAVPNGLSKTETPTSFTIIGGLYKDNAVLQIANWYQQQTEWEEMHPDLGKLK